MWSLTKGLVVPIPTFVFIEELYKILLPEAHAKVYPVSPLFTFFPNVVFKVEMFVKRLVLFKLIELLMLVELELISALTLVMLLSIEVLVLVMFCANPMFISFNAVEVNIPLNPEPSP